MLILNGREIKFKRALKLELYKEELLIEGDVQQLRELCSLKNEYSDTFLKSILYYIHQNHNFYKKIFKYIERCQEKNFNYDRFLKYIIWREENRSESGSETFYKLAYGDDWKKVKDAKFSKTITPYVVEYWTKKGHTPEDALIQIINYKSNKATNLAKFIERHGEEKGREIFNKFKNTSKHTLEKFITKYGEQEGPIQYESYLKTKDSSSFAWALKKANGDEELANNIYLDKIKACTIDYNWALRKANGDAELASSIYQELLNTKFKDSSVSKESLRYFIPLTESLIATNNFMFEDFNLGYLTSREWVLHDREYSRGYSYDFCIKKYNLIIEYNGDMWHANYEKYTLEELQSKKKLYPGTPLDRVTYDKRKIALAEELGYKVLLIWSDDTKEVNDAKIIEFFKNNNINIQEYESNKNK